MTLNTKLAFEIWAGVVVLIIAIGSVAGLTLMLGNDVTPLLVKTQLNNPNTSPAPLLQESLVQNASLGISQTLLGGAQP